MGVYARLLDSEGRFIDDAKWRAALDLHEAVGDCGSCGFIMTVLPADDGAAFEEHNGLLFYSMRCLGCNAEVSLPRGEVQRRRGRRAA